MAGPVVANILGAEREVGIVKAVNVAIVDGSGNQITAFGGSGGTSHSDDAAFTIGAASSVTPTGYLADETTPDSVDEGDVGVPRMTLSRKPYAVISDPSAERHATVRDAGSNDALNVAIVDAAGDHVTSFGGGVQYTEGDIDTTISGTATMWEDGSNTLRPISATYPLPVNIVAGGGSGGTSITDDAAFTVGSSALTPAGGTYKSVRDSVDDGDAGAFAMSAKRGLYASPETPNGDSVCDDTNDAIKVVNATAANLNATVIQTTGTNLHAVVDSGTITTITNVVHIDDNSSTITVDNAALSVVGGGAEATALRVTLANDSTGVVSIDDNGSSITVDGTVDTELTTADLDTGAGTDTRAVVGLVYGASGGGVLVSTTNPLPVADNGSSLTVDGTVAATQSGAWSVTNISGTISLPTGAATESTLATLDGKVTACNTGAVTISAALPVGANAIGKLAANSGVDIGDVDVTSVVPGTGATSLGKAEDAIHATGDTGVMALSVSQASAAALAGAAGDYQPLVTSSANGRLFTSAVIDTALPSGTNAIGKLAANNGVDIGDVDIASIAAGDNNIGNVDVVTLPGVAGTAAHDAADSGNPIKIGGRADTTFQTAVADGDRVDALFDVYGVQRVRADHPNLWSYHSNGSSALTDQQVAAAPGVGLSLYITDIVFSTGAATACNIFFEEGATTILGPYHLEATAGRGIALHFLTPKKCTANTALTVTTSAAIVQGLDVAGFIAP